VCVLRVVAIIAADFRAALNASRIWCGHIPVRGVPPEFRIPARGWDNCGRGTAAIGRSGMGNVMAKHKSH
jgi:hypothetical protein